VKALVTGAARGIGAAVAARLRADGLEVVTVDRTGGCDLQLDVAHDEFPDLPDVAVCVANAAVTDTVAPAHRMTPEQWQRDVDVNLTGAFRTVQACLAGMRERRFGHVVAISSGAARSGLPGQVAYSASKAGVVGMIKTIAAENVGRGITANAVLPGLIATEKVLAMPPEVLERARTAVPAGHLAEPSEVAALVAFLASDAAGYITGEAIGIDGGASLNTLSLGSAGTEEKSARSA
jgi:NAD(P)-dependent dehydrogenase (short-subunit alcohol dehydrogenase family)